MDSSQKLIDLLMHEMRANHDFVRIHAAEALSENGYGNDVATELQPEMDTAGPMYRIGVWRVLVLIAADETERGALVGRIRRVLLDPAAPDRVHAAETLGKLGVGFREDRPAIHEWLKTLADAGAPFGIWALLQSSAPAERDADHVPLRRLLSSKDELARQRADFVLSRLKYVPTETETALAGQLDREPPTSAARVYLVSALCERSQMRPEFRDEFLHFLEKGKANEQAQAARMLGGHLEYKPQLQALLTSPEADARIAAAAALLRLSP